MKFLHSMIKKTSILSIFFFLISINLAKQRSFNDNNIQSVVKNHLDPMDMNNLSTFWSEYGFMWDNVGRLCRGGFFISSNNKRNGQGVNTAAWRQALDVFSQPLITIQEHRQNGTITPSLIYQSMLGIITIMKDQYSFLTYTMNSTQQISDSTWSIAGVDDTIINKTQLSEIIWTRNALFSTMVNTTEQHSFFWTFDDDYEKKISLSRQFSIQVYIQRMEEYEEMVKKQWDKYKKRRNELEEDFKESDCMCKLAAAYSHRENIDQSQTTHGNVLDIEWFDFNAFNVTDFTEKQLNITEKITDIGDGNGFDDIDDNDSTDPSLNIVAWPILVKSQTGTSLSSGIRAMMGNYLSLGNGRLSINRSFTKMLDWLKENITDSSEKMDRDLDLASLDGRLDAQFDELERKQNPPTNNATDDEENQLNSSIQEENDASFTDNEITKNDDEEEKVILKDDESISEKIMIIRTKNSSSNLKKISLFSSLTVMVMVAILQNI